MSFVLIPSLWKTADAALQPGRVVGRDDFPLVDATRGLVCRKLDGEWSITIQGWRQRLFRINEGPWATQQPFYYLGKPVWRASGGYVFHSMAEEAWIWKESVSEPLAWRDRLDGTWRGDRWFVFSGDPAGSNPVEGEAKGTYQNDENPPSMTTQSAWPRWVWDATRSGSSRAPLGVYSAVDAEFYEGEMSGLHTIGSMRFIDGENRYWRESLDGQSVSCGALVCSYDSYARRWILGSRAAADATWWQSDGRSGPTEENTEGDSWFLRPMKWRGADPVYDSSRQPIHLTFLDYYETPDGNATVNMAEVALWR